MVFSSFSFLFLFLPVVLLGYVLSPAKLKNVFFLMASLVFYAWGEPAFVFVMLTSIVLNYFSGLLVDVCKRRGSVHARTVLGIGVGLNLLLLGYFKYTVFLLTFVIDVLGFAGAAPCFDVPDVRLPIGISFFTFQGISYIVDVYRGEVAAQRNFVLLAMYKAMFPQLIAGPIVRYKTVESEIDVRRVTLGGVTMGLRFFSYGMAKKVLIANSMGAVADAVFDLPAGSASVPLAWMGIMAYTLQIYFDFSGYSDMAIGLGLLFGFHFPQNFNYPYIADSMTNFWRRWHMSLSTWFRDYLYIPLGGNRLGALRTYMNLFVVFCATGIWHGANWTFLIWGLWHGLFLVFERLFRDFFVRLPRIFRHCYVLLAVVVGWVFFRSESIGDAIFYISAMLNPSRIVPEPLFYELSNNARLFFFVAGVVFSMPVFLWARKRFETSPAIENAFSLCAMGCRCSSSSIPHIIHSFTSGSNHEEPTRT